jgi:hypothetical protein
MPVMNNGTAEAIRHRLGCGPPAVVIRMVAVYGLEVTLLADQPLALGALVETKGIAQRTD